VALELFDSVGVVTVSRIKKVCEPLGYSNKNEEKKFANIERLRNL
jgi:hypothetical protein